MKIMMTILMTLTLLYTSCSENNQSETDIDKQGYIKVELSIEGMSCMSCVANVKKTLSNLDGLIDVGVSLEKKKCKGH